MSISPYGPLSEAMRDTDREIELIAAGLVRAGVPLWDALERARDIYRRRQAMKGLESRKR